MLHRQARYSLLSLCVLMLMGSLSLTGAASGQATGAEEVASRCAMFQALSPQVPPECQSGPTIRLRSVVLQPPGAAPARDMSPAKTDQVYAFTTRVQFALDSAQLSPTARQFLDTLASVLQDDLMAKKVIRIEGHTDSLGSDEHNLLLSHRRALAVQRYLHEHHGIALQRLAVMGKGKYELYDTARPNDAVNRRVQFVNISDSSTKP